MDVLEIDILKSRIQDQKYPISIFKKIKINVKPVYKYIILLVISFILLGGLIVYQRARFYDGKLHVVFCDVGQGDGIFIRTPKNKNILIDGGPDESILSCLSSHMPFWDRTVDIVILTHPHADHLQGLISVLKSYTVLSFDTEELVNKTAGYRELLDLVGRKNIPKRILTAGDTFVIRDGVVLQIVGPTKGFLQQTSPNGIIAESKEFASVETLLTFGSFRALFTGDSQAIELEEAVQTFGIHSVSVLQVPHHGSKTGITRELLGGLSPGLAVISVGKKNRYGHPTKEALDLLVQKNIKILRTDLPADATHQALQAGQVRDVEIVSDGKEFSVSQDTE